MTGTLRMVLLCACVLLSQCSGHRTGQTTEEQGHHHGYPGTGHTSEEEGHRQDYPGIGELLEQRETTQKLLIDDNGVEDQQPPPMSTEQNHQNSRVKIPDSRQKCRAICLHCRRVLSMRWSALCNVQCRKEGGKAFNICEIVWLELRRD